MASSGCRTFRPLTQTCCSDTNYSAENSPPHVPQSWSKSSSLVVLCRQTKVINSLLQNRVKKIIKGLNIVVSTVNVPEVRNSVSSSVQKQAGQTGGSVLFRLRCVRPSGRPVSSLSVTYCGPILPGSSRPSHYHSQRTHRGLCLQRRAAHLLQPFTRSKPRFPPTSRAPEPVICQCEVKFPPRTRFGSGVVISPFPLLSLRDSYTLNYQEVQQKAGPLPQHEPRRVMSAEPRMFLDRTSFFCFVFINLLGWIKSKSLSAGCNV